VIAAAIGAGALAMLALSLPLPFPILGAAAAVAGLAAGLPFATIFTGAQRLRPDAPAAAVGFVNAAAVLTIVVGVPLAGLTFSLPGDGRIAFAVMAALWAAALVALRRTSIQR
jgi:predicted MFS family arabinose efflux permease